MDPDLAGIAPAAPRSVSAGYRNPALLALVTVGGTAGTLVRAVLEEAVPAPAGTWPWATFAINVSGALVLGFLLEVLVRTGPDAGWRRSVRLLIGTGFLGGYTTYSTFAVEVAQLTAAARPVVAAIYAVVSVVLGPAAAGVGYLLARRVATVAAATDVR